MVGWYIGVDAPKKPNMDPIYSHDGKVVLYKRKYNNEVPYVIYKGATLLADVTEWARASKAFHDAVATFCPYKAQI